MRPSYSYVSYLLSRFQRGNIVHGTACGSDINVPEASQIKCKSVRVGEADLCFKTLEATCVASRGPAPMATAMARQHRWKQSFMRSFHIHEVSLVEAQPHGLVRAPLQNTA